LITQTPLPIIDANQVGAMAHRDCGDPGGNPMADPAPGPAGRSQKQRNQAQCPKNAGSMPHSASAHRRLSSGHIMMAVKNLNE